MTIHREDLAARVAELASLIGARTDEVSLSVRAVHDTGGEDYRPVVAGEVVQTEADAQFAGDLDGAVRAARERAAIPAPEPDLTRDMNDMRDWGQSLTFAPARCPGCGMRDDVPMDSAPLPETDDEARNYCTTCGRRMD
jgi:hypothetical protein